MIARILGLWISLVIVLLTVSSAQEWVARYNGPANDDDFAHAIAVDNSGNVYVTGWSRGPGTATDYATIKYDSSGAEQWVVRYNGPINEEEYAYAIALSNSGNIYVTGRSKNSETYYDYATIKYDSTGVEQWVARYNGTGDSTDAAKAIVVDNSGNIYVTGRSMGADTSYDYATVKYDSSGTEQWVARYNGPGNGDDQAFAIALDNNSNIYITGNSMGLGMVNDYATIKYDSSGVEQWVARYNGPDNGYDRAYAIAVSNSGNVYVTGESMGSGTHCDYATVKYDSLGVEQWVARYNGPGNNADYAYANAVDNSENIYVTGASRGLDTWFDYATIKYNSSGVEQWVARYNDPDNGGDWAWAITTDNAGNVYVTGNSWAAVSSSDYATVKYDSLGVEQWVARYNGPGNSGELPYAIIVDSLCNVYVTGVSWGLGTEADYATIKYSSTGVQEQEAVSKPLTKLNVHPNPFCNKINIGWRTEGSGEVAISIYDATGILIKEFGHTANQQLAQVTWLGDDNFGRKLPSGVYFLKFKAGDYSATEKLLLIR